MVYLKDNFDSLIENMGSKKVKIGPKNAKKL